MIDSVIEIHAAEFLQSLQEYVEARRPLRAPSTVIEIRDERGEIVGHIRPSAPSDPEPIATFFGFGLITRAPAQLARILRDCTEEHPAPENVGPSPTSRTPLTTFDDDRGEPTKTERFRAAHGRPLRYRRVLVDGVISVEPIGGRRRQEALLYFGHGD